MSSETKIIISTISFFFTGLLITFAHYPTTQAAQLQNDIESAGGLIISIISSAYLLDHLLLKIKGEIEAKKTITTTTTTTAPIVPVVPTETQTVQTAQPAA